MYFQMYINANDNSCLELFTTVWVVNVFYNCLINSSIVQSLPLRDVTDLLQTKTALPFCLLV